jgi:hypothetical protein
MGYDAVADRYHEFVRDRITIHRISIPALVSTCGIGQRFSTWAAAREFWRAN